MNKNVEQMINSERLSAIDEVIVTVNHRINNPLTTILNYAELLKMKSNGGQSVSEKELEKIISAAKEIKNVTHQLTNLQSAERVDYLDNISMISLP